MSRLVCARVATLTCRQSCVKVHEVYTRCNLARDQQQPDTLQMLGAIESRIEELIQGLDEAYQQATDMGCNATACQQRLYSQTCRMRILSCVWRRSRKAIGAKESGSELACMSKGRHVPLSREA